jgi:hypothetical protein
MSFRWRSVVSDVRRHDVPAAGTEADAEPIDNDGRREHRLAAMVAGA